MLKVKKSKKCPLLIHPLFNIVKDSNIKFIKLKLIQVIYIYIYEIKIL